MPSNPFPNVPDYPGVPPIPRNGSASPTISAQLQYGSGTQPSNVPDWGVYQTGTSNASGALYSPTQGGTLSFVDFDLDGASDVLDFPVEAQSNLSGAQFASYNKVWVPLRIRVTYALSGTQTEKQQLLNAIETAKETVLLWDIYTPDCIYTGYVAERYSYRRTADHGASLIVAEIGFKQTLQVMPTYTNVATVNAQSPSAAPPSNSGIVNPSQPTSILYGWFGKNQSVGVGGNSAQGAN